MGAEEQEDWVKKFGSVLVVLGVSMWGVYAIGKYVLGWQITDRDVLPYHLAVVLPGMLLRYHHFFFEDIPNRFSGSKEKMPDQGTVRALKQDQGLLFKALVVVNNFVHDLFTGLWTSSVLVIYLLHRKTRSPEGLLVSPALHDVMRTLFWLGIASVVLIVLTGSLRVLYYRAESIRGDREIKKQLLIVKHVLFTFVFIGGTYLSYLYAFK